MTGNIVGEPIEDFVRDQINIRQSNQFSGYGDTLRTSRQLQYLNNRNAWIKLASSVSIEQDIYLSNESSSPSRVSAITDTSQKIQNPPTRKLENIGINDTSNYLGTQLAEKAVLFNSLSSYIPSSGSFGLSRSNITNNTGLWNNFAYGLGGTEYGIQPPPGIIGATVDSLNRGSIRKANVTLKAHNKFQFDIIELLYLRLGFTMMLEWGWDKYIDNNGVLLDIKNTIIEDKWFNPSSNGISQLEMLNIIQNLRTKYVSNYDGFFGKVSNFTWSFNPDGSYDISIDLITVGDVIESLKVNTLAKENFFTESGTLIKIDKDDILYNTNIAKAATLNTIGYFLYKKAEKILETPDSNYIVFDKIKLGSSSKNPQYYIRLGEFLSQLESLIIPKIQNDGKTPVSQVIFEKIGCYVSYFPNQISLDPRVCLFKPSLNSYGDITGLTDPSYFNIIPIQYLGSIKGQICGILTNLYINFEFISGLLIANGGPDQELSLFKFLQDLCDGINNALGGVNKLEPVIKDDYKITIIDQTLSIPNEDNVTLEVYGYNTKDNTSNFVKDVKFVSKITPKLASMISIGATAAGSSVSEIDGTAFSKWSEGLVDRFSKEILEPNGLSQLLEEKAKTREEYKLKFLNFKRAYEGSTIQQIGEFGKEIITSTLSGLANAVYRVDSFFQNKFAESQQIAAIEEARDNDINEKRIINEPFLESIHNTAMYFEDYVITAPLLEKQRLQDKKYTPDEINNLISKNYAIYLLNSFGGENNEIQVETLQYNSQMSGTGASTSRISTNNVKTQTLQIKDDAARYLEFDDTFISQGKSAYRVYINNLNNVRYNTEKTPSSEVGFIPLSFELILDGISGIKIYNKLSINNKFLPSNYPESLNFIITKVNHNISNNSWDTSLSTISMPVTKPYKFNSVPNQTNNENINVIGPQPDNGSPFQIVDNRNNRAIMTIDNLLSELDPIAHPAFRKFFDTLTQKYSGYKAGVNDIRRTWEESYNLKYISSTPSYSPTNASPGQSRHSYGLAIDINIETPASTTKRTLKKGVKQPWIEEGINQVAIDAGLVWGGDFTGYVDAVHFEFVPNYFNSPYSQILVQAKAIDPTLVPPFTPSSNGLAKCKTIDSLIKEGKIKLQ